MKKVGVAILIILLTMTAVSATCSIIDKNSCTGDNKIRVLGISHIPKNAHGEKPSLGLQPLVYDYVLCCDATNGETRTCSGTNKILGLSSETNAHAEGPGESNYGSTNNICFGDFNCILSEDCNTVQGTCSGTAPDSCGVWPLCRGVGCSFGFFGCNGAPTPCSEIDNAANCRSQTGCTWTTAISGATYNSILSLSHPTNAHLGKPSEYDLQICCTTEDGTEEPQPNVCGTCTSDNQCGSEHNCEGYDHCDVSLGACVQCTENTHCRLDEFCNSVGSCLKLDPQDNTIICSELEDQNSCEAGTIRTTKPGETNPNCQILETIGCIWDSTEGCTGPKVEESLYNPSDPNCAGEELNDDCIYTQTLNPEGGCSEGVDSFQVTYISTDPTCSRNSATVSCLSIDTEKLPFFNFYNFLITLLAITIIYGILIRKRG